MRKVAPVVPAEGAQAIEPQKDHGSGQTDIAAVRGDRKQLARRDLLERRAIAALYSHAGLRRRLQVQFRRERHDRVHQCRQRLRH